MSSVKTSKTNLKSKRSGDGHKLEPRKDVEQSDARLNAEEADRRLETDTRNNTDKHNHDSGQCCNCFQTNCSNPGYCNLR